MHELYLGLMSGTSVDGIDVVLADFSGIYPTICATHYQEISLSLREKILRLCEPGDDEINRLGEIDVELATQFANAALALLIKEKIAPEKIRAIGSHGQTIRHHPAKNFTLQIGDPNIIAAKTGITTVADFRRKDMALGGQGAPLVPAFHESVFASQKNHRAIVNIGGIANVTILRKDDSPIIGFDTGPGNCLLDAWMMQHQHARYDLNGAWAEQGNIDNELLKALLADPFFIRTPPKSTGKEYFNLTWLKQYLSDSVSALDVQTTLAELTAKTIIDAIECYFLQGEIFICGGGAHNNYLVSRIKCLAENYSVTTTDSLGVHPDWVEALAFAWLAKQTLARKPGNLTSVTGAYNSAILGGVYYV